MILAPRFLPRLASTVGLFTRYGLHGIASQRQLKQLVPGEYDPAERTDVGTAERAAAFRARLVELGPAYIKLGQVLSTRPDIMPPAFIHELESLQDDVEALPFDAIEETVSTELGGRISKLFAGFDETPLGTASLGQVHAAELRDGREVVVKVQRPEIREQLAEDLEFFRELAAFLTVHTGAGERVDMLGVVQQLERSLADELDYLVEARNAATFRRSLAEFPRIVVPRVIEAYTTSRVLTSERVHGMKVDGIPQVTRLEHDFRELAEDFAKAYLKQITIDGHFHADPHPGNVFVLMPGGRNPRTPAEVVSGERRDRARTPVTQLSRIEQAAQRDAPPPPTGPAVRLALIDFGMTARLSASLRASIVDLLMDIADNRGDAAADTLIDIGEPIEPFDRSRYTREIAALVARNYDVSVGEVRAGSILYDAINISYQSGLRLPAELVLLAKALFNLDAVTRSLDPTYSPIDAIREYGNQIANDRAKRELSPRRLFQIATAASDLMGHLPHRLDVITQRMANNDFALRIDAPQLANLLGGMQKIANRIFSGLVITGLLVASAMLLPYQKALGIAGFVISGVLGLYMVASILLSDRGRKGGRAGGGARRGE
ncbi:MAG: ABC1 kinase family protein [Gemmatimonadaceae bacterium]